MKKLLQYAIKPRQGHKVLFCSLPGIKVLSLMLMFTLRHFQAAVILEKVITKAFFLDMKKYYLIETYCLLDLAKHYNRFFACAFLLHFFSAFLPSYWDCKFCRVTSLLSYFVSEKSDLILFPGIFNTPCVCVCVVTLVLDSEIIYLFFWRSQPCDVSYLWVAWPKSFIVLCFHESVLNFLLNKLGSSTHLIMLMWETETDGKKFNAHEIQFSHPCWELWIKSGKFIQLL